MKTETKKYLKIGVIALIVIVIALILLLRFWPVLLVAFLLPEPFNLAMPVNGVAFACFLFTMVMGCLLVVAYLMLVIIATIYVLNPMGIRLIAISMTEFLTGALIPLPFLLEKLFFYKLHLEAFQKSLKIRRYPNVEYLCLLDFLQQICVYDFP